MASVNLSSTIRISRMSSSSSFSLSSQLRCHTSFKPRILVSLEARTSVPLSFRLPSLSNRILAYSSPFSVVDSGSPVANSTRQNNGVFIVGEFMTKRERLHVVKPTTTIDEALEALVENRITGLPVIDDNWNLVGVVSDYDILALDSISGSGRNEGSLFPEVGRTWKTFNEIQKLLGKTNGKVVSEVMTPAPLVVRETTNLEDVARLLLETKYRRFPVVDSSGKLVGIITRGNVIRAALHIKRQMGR